MKTAIRTNEEGNSRSIQFSELSLLRQKLIRACQLLQFGAFCSIPLRGGEPLLESAVVLSDERLDVQERRRESLLNDFVLSKEWKLLLARFDEIQNGMVERLEVRAGVPRRVLFKSRVSAFGL